MEQIFTYSKIVMRYPMRGTLKLQIYKVTVFCFYEYIEAKSFEKILQLVKISSSIFTNFSLKDFSASEAAISNLEQTFFC